MSACHQCGSSRIQHNGGCPADEDRRYQSIASLTVDQRLEWLRVRTKLQALMWESISDLLDVAEAAQRVDKAFTRDAEPSYMDSIDQVKALRAQHEALKAINGSKI